MAHDTERPVGPSALGGRLGSESDGAAPPALPPPDVPPAADPAEAASSPDPGDVRLTRRVHIVLGFVIAGLGAWLLYRSCTELDFKGGAGEPGPGYLPVLVTICLIGLGLALSAVWMWGKRARSGDVPVLSLSRAHMTRAVLVWLALVACAALIEPFGFLIAGEVLVILVIVVIERIRSVAAIVTLLLVPVAMYVLFEVLLAVQLPEGTLWQ
ncbi:MAG: tripartite tricarboxylate transporter TctB family protein [Actinobacteria bacterium]|nr:tripartite tricarboxylate transporter TctB family protein [Actinomycetota bacterium]